MTALEEAFGSLLYTDCQPGQGLLRSGGFQFQAASSGVSREAMSLVQRSALYEPPVSWMREHRPVAEYQPSLAHLFDDVYVTARGVYLGLEANGTRGGNQLTHALVTANPQCYGQVRPAQLWDAHWWLTQPHPSTQCDPVPAEPEIGPLTADAVQEWVLGRRESLDWLTAVCSAVDRVHDEPRRRVLFVSSSAADVLGWIAAATLLLPQSRALRVSFRIFAANPRYSQHDILAVHPDWAGAFNRPSGDSEFAVFNVDSGWHAEVEPTDGAAHWARRFLALDPYDVIDAVELAAQFATARSAHQGPPHPSMSDRLASTAVLLGERTTTAQHSVALCTWLAAQPRLPVDEVVLPVCEAVLDGGEADVVALREMDAAMPRHGAPAGLAAQVRLHLFAAEIDAVVAGDPEPDGFADLPPAPWTDWHRQQAAERVEEVAAIVAPEWMNLLLRVATRFGAKPRVPCFLEAAETFVRWWAGRPETGIDPACWSCGEHLVDLLRDELARRLTGLGAGTMRTAIRQHWWRLLWPVFSDLSMELDRLVASAAVARGGSVTRAQTITAVLGYLREPGFAGDQAATELAWSACFDLAIPTTAELVDFLRSVQPGYLANSVAARVWVRLADVPTDEFTHVELDLLRLLDGHRHQPTQPMLRQLLDSDASLSDWLSWVRSDYAVPNLPEDAVLALRIRSDQLLRLLLDEDLSRAATIVRSGGEGLHTVLAEALPPIWLEPAGGPRTTRAVALGFHSMRNCDNEYLRRRYEGEVVTWIVRVPEWRHAEVIELLNYIDQGDAQRFQAMAGRHGQGSWKRTKPSGEDADASSAQAKPARWFRRQRRER